MEKKVKYQIENVAINVSKCSEREHKQWRIQDFQGVTPIPNLYLRIFFQKLHENERIYTERGAHP